MALGTWAAALALAEMVPTLFKWIGGDEKSGKKKITRFWRYCRIHR